MYAIETFDLEKKFGWIFSRKKVKALNKLSLKVPENVIFGFLGPNGAGKTTTIKILLGLVIPSSGHSKIFGVDTSDPQTRNHVGFLPENPKFYSYLTAYDFLDFCGKMIHLEAMDRQQRAEMLLEKVGLAHAAGQKVEGFSRGMLQRLGIAQALISDPDLIILDEPITGLDPMGRAEVKRILGELRDEGKTIFFSSHILSDVEKMCDRVAVLNHGELIDEGRLEDLRSDIGLEIHVSGVKEDITHKGLEICDKITFTRQEAIFSIEERASRQQLIELINAYGGKVEREVRKQEELETFFLRRIQEDEARRISEIEEKGTNKK